MARSPVPFQKPSAAEGLFNRAWGFLVGLGLGFAHSYLLETRGRKSGRTYLTPVNLLSLGEARFLVAPRGVTAWVRNARAGGRIVLRRGGARAHYRVRELADAEKPAVLKAYLDRFKTSVGRFFAVPAGSPPGDFAAVAGDHPVFELLPASPGKEGA